MRLRKTREKTVITLDIGAFRAKETIRWCPEHPLEFASSELRALTPAQCTFGFDILVYVGKALYLRGKNEPEIIAELHERNMAVSDREIGYLGKKFVLYVTLLHQESQAQIQRALVSQGGYILHVDGTCEGDSPHLFTGMDGISQWILAGAKLPSENADDIIAFFRAIQRNYGDPIALVHDMGKGILKAVQEVFPGLPDFICHYHFLRDLGNDLLKQNHEELIARLRKLKIRATLRYQAKTLEPFFHENKQRLHKLLREEHPNPRSIVSQVPAAFAYALLHWALHPIDQLGGYGFPFDRPHVLLAQRLKEMEQTFGRLIKASFRGDLRVLESNWPFFRLFRELQPMVKDEELNQILSQIEEKIEIFDQFRYALNLALPDGKRGLNDDGENENIKTIEARVIHFRKEIAEDPYYADKKYYRTMIAQIDKYWNKLFADPISVNTPQGPLLIQPQRTNNIMERFFRDIRRRYRKKSGVASFRRTLKTMLPSTPLVCNLEHEEYEKIMLNGCVNLEERFAQMDSRLISEQIQQSRVRPDILPMKIKKIIGTTNFPKKLNSLYATIFG